MHSTSPIRSASDGSSLDFLGYQGWLVATLENEILIQGFVATEGCVEDTHSCRSELCGNIATFTIINIIRCVYSFAPRSIEQVCDHQHDTNSVFDKTKVDADAIIIAPVSLSELQLHSPVKPYWVARHSDKRGPPYTMQEEESGRKSTH
jgi:hypothetical protein